MLIEDIIKQTTIQFIQLWNCWELDQVMNYMKEDIIVESPNIQRLYPNNHTGIIQGKQDVKKYWLDLKHIMGAQKLELISFHKVGNQIHTVNQIEGRVEKLHAYFSYNEYAKIIALKFEYIH